MDDPKHREKNNLEKCIDTATEVDEFIETKKKVTDDGLGSMWRFWRRRRFIVIVMAFLGQVTKEVLRTNLSVAILPMTENYSTTGENGTTVYVRDFEWDTKTRGFLLSVFYYGYIAANTFGGILAVKYGGWKIFGLGIAVTAISTLLTPAVAKIHLYLLIALRIFEGISEGVLVPGLESVYAVWIPLQERSSLVGFVTSGMSWGVFIGMSASSVISYYCGWHAIFYITGAGGLMWYLAWLLFVKENPRSDKNISYSELTYIQDSLGKGHKYNRNINSIPYLKILTSKPLWALLIVIVPTSGLFAVFTTLLPTYVKDVLKHDTRNSGFLTSLPFAANVVTMYIVSPVADFLINRKILSPTVTRKIYICGGITIAGSFCFVIQWVDSTLAILACLIAILTTGGSAYIQLLVNMLDLAPNYSSVLAGLITTIGALCGISLPTIIGHITTNKTAEEWHIVFSMMAGMCLVAAAVYGLLGSGQLQPWAVEKTATNSRSSNEEE